MREQMAHKMNFTGDTFFIVGKSDGNDDISFGSELEGKASQSCKCAISQYILTDSL